MPFEAIRQGVSGAVCASVSPVYSAEHQDACFSTVFTYYTTLSRGGHYLLEPDDPDIIPTRQCRNWSVYEGNHRGGTARLHNVKFGSFIELRGLKDSSILPKIDPTSFIQSIHNFCAFRVAPCTRGCVLVAGQDTTLTRLTLMCSTTLTAESTPGKILKTELREL